MSIVFLFAGFLLSRALRKRLLALIRGQGGWVRVLGAREA